MIKNTKTITRYILVLFITISLFSFLIPSTSAGILDKVYECNYELVVIEDENAANSPFLPVDMVMQIPLTLNLEFYGRYAEEMEDYYNVEAIVELYVNNTPSWATATINPNSLLVPVSADPVKANATLSVKVDENAIPFRGGIIELRIVIGGLGAIKKRVFDIPITFTPGFLPFLDIHTKDTVKEISPQDTARFNIEIENKGNAKTDVICEILNVPDGWSAEITSNLVLGTKALGGDVADAISLAVKSPYSSGYHNEREIIQVAITPAYYDNNSIMGEKYIVSFIVQNEGFSTPGFGVPLTLIAFIAVIFSTYKKQQKNNKKLQWGGGRKE